VVPINPPNETRFAQFRNIDATLVHALPTFIVPTLRRFESPENKLANVVILAFEKSRLGNVSILRQLENILVTLVQLLVFPGKVILTKR
jgi:hypothetical protein